MPTLTRKEVDDIAMLARLHLEGREPQHLQADLGSILDHFATLAAVNTDGVEPMTHAMPLELRLRDDEPAESLPAGTAVKSAPARSGDLFAVPAMIPSSEDA